MEQELSRFSDTTNIPGNLPNDIETPGSAERAADLLREQEPGPVPLGPATPVENEDAVLFVETATTPEAASAIPSAEAVLAGTDLEAGVPWYRSRWVYLGAGLVVAAALGIGTVLAVRNLSRQNRRTRIMRRVTRPLGRASIQALPRTQGWLSQRTGQLSGQASRLTGQAQGQISRLARRTQGTAASLIPARQAPSRNLLSRTQQQLSSLSQQANVQLRSLGATTRATTARAVGKTQANLAQVSQGLASGAAKTRAGVRRGWKLSRNFTLGVGVGALWTYLYAPQSGEATRQYLTQLVPRQLRTK